MATLSLLLNSVPSLASEHCPRTYRVGVSQIGYSYYLLDDGTPVRVKDFLGFAEKVENKW